jgi:hypothetical protein
MAKEDPVNAMLDCLVEQVQEHCGAFILARTCHMLGSNVIDMLVDHVVVTGTVGFNVEIEPIPVADLRQFKAVFPEFVVEVFHGKLVQHWQDLLGTIFAHYVNLHLSGQRPFVEAGATSVRVDFALQVPVVDQIRESLCRDFNFRKYVERHKLVATLRDRAGKTKNEADIVLRHVHIRNAIQHHHGVLQAFMFRELGCHELKVLDDSGTDRTLKTGDKVAVSVPELDRFRRALLMIAQGWKEK